MDAYTYLLRGKVFANAQTGNILLFGVNLSEGSFREALRYFFPVLAFALGIVTAELIRHFFPEGKGFHWRQWAVLAECVISVFCRAYAPYIQRVCQCHGFLCLRHSGGELSKGKRKCLRHHHVHWKFPFRHTGCLRLFISGERSSLLKGLTYYGIIGAFTFAQWWEMLP